MFKKSLNQWTVGGFEGEVPVLECVRISKEIGFDAVELCFGAGELVPQTPEESLLRLKKEIDALDIGISSLATGFYWGKSLSSPDETERQEAVEFTRTYLKAASIFGVDSILVVPGTVAVPWDSSRPVVPASQVWDLSHRSLKSLLPLAEELRIRICVENVWNRFLTGPFELASFIDSFGSPWVKAYFDVGNVLLFGYPEHWIEILGDRIGRVHLKNFKCRNGGGTLDDFTGSLFEGDVQWENVFKALKSVGYEGYLTAEMLITEEGLPDNELARRTCEEMSRLIEQFG